MSLVTFDGHIGAGAPELGRRIARMFDWRYVDRLLLPGVSGTGKAERKFSDRFWSGLERFVSGFALGNAAGDPYFQVPESLLLPLTWEESGPRAAALPSSDENEVEALARRGKAVLVHRAGVVTVAPDVPAVRVGLFASWEDRVRRVMSREGLSRVHEAERIIERRQASQAAYFREHHGADPEDATLYDLCLDTSSGNLNVAALEIARTVRERGALAIP